MIKFDKENFPFYLHEDMFCKEGFRESWANKFDDLLMDLSGDKNMNSFMIDKSALKIVNISFSLDEIVTVFCKIKE